MTLLDTSRLLLRPITLEDYSAKVAIDQQPELHQYQGFVIEQDGSKRGRTPEEIHRMLEMRVAEFRLQGFGQWATVLKDTNEMIGWAGLQFYLLNQGAFSTPEIELFYGLSRSYWDQGLITEACRELIRYGFEDLKLRRITSCAMQENTRSIAVMRRVGMHVEPDPGEPGMMLGILDSPHPSTHT